MQCKSYFSTGRPGGYGLNVFALSRCIDWFAAWPTWVISLPCIAVYELTWPFRVITNIVCNLDSIYNDIMACNAAMTACVFRQLLTVIGVYGSLRWSLQWTLFFPAGKYSARLERDACNLTGALLGSGFLPPDGGGAIENPPFYLGPEGRTQKTSQRVKEC